MNCPATATSRQTHRRVCNRKPLRHSHRNALAYDYDGDHNRIKEITYLNNVNTQTTLYVGNQFYEEINKIKGVRV